MLNIPQLAGAPLTADAYGNYNFYWTGGDDDSYVVAQVFALNGRFEAVASDLGSAGSISISAVDVNCGPGLHLYCNVPVPAGQPVEAIITQAPVWSQTAWTQPAGAPSLPFAAPGLAMGGELTWTYVWDLKALAGN